jgi:peptide/nickel transport system ATP-binding protein
MYAGRIVEAGRTDHILDHPRHPYTIGLLDSLPGQNEPGRILRQIPGMTPSLLHLDDGCAFRERCFCAAGGCELPVPVRQADDGHMVRCLRPQ